MKEFRVPLSAENCEIMMNFPERVASQVLELSAHFSEIAGQHVDFPNTVIVCINYAHYLCNLEQGGDE